MPYFCYLLVSCNAPSTCYVGFTKTPRKRLRQHNGEISAGAWKTHKHRPWKHVGIVSGFPNGIVAFQFEWQWQHAKKVRILKEYQGKQRGGSPAMLGVLAALLSTPLWQRLNLVVHFLDNDKKMLFDKMLNHPSTSVLTTNAEIDRMHLAAAQSSSHQTDLPCQICQQVEVRMTSNSSSSSSGSSSVNARRMWCCPQSSCLGYRAHLLCMSQQQQTDLGRSDAVTVSTMVPITWQCGQCGVTVPWSQCVMQSYYNGSNNNLEHATAEDDEDNGDDDDDDDFEECPGKRSRKNKAATKKNSGKRVAIELNLLSDNDDDDDEEEEGAGEIIVIDDSDDDSDGDDGLEDEEDDDDVFR